MNHSDSTFSRQAGALCSSVSMRFSLTRSSLRNKPMSFHRARAPEVRRVRYKMKKCGSESRKSLGVPTVLTASTVRGCCTSTTCG